MTLKLPVIGTSFYCPDCGRLLVTFNGDGTANLAGQSEAKTMAEQYFDEDGNICEPREALVTEAICHLPSCIRRRKVRAFRGRLRNRLRRK